LAKIAENCDHNIDSGESEWPDEFVKKMPKTYPAPFICQTWCKNLSVEEHTFMPNLVTLQVITK
jgi:hypothetical protein